MPTLPSLRSKVWVEAGLGLNLREGRVGTSPETWIDPTLGTITEAVPLRTISLIVD